ncbi:hypothetical protein BD289DRAFT_480168 [Coniella lustricola]|uniref:P-loop containing nucleoside triphosphate hydrolase protein n=1 Tax=Coniella lustricola TaxID=2025994 RepID=A0A2T3AGH6_9PEZI|nr:hypothetical protein BD289DRAFT_480168 [Coniella lustricola]
MPPRIETIQPSFRRMDVVEAPPLAVTESVGTHVYMGIMPRGGQLSSIRDNGTLRMEHIHIHYDIGRMSSDGSWEQIPSRVASSGLYNSAHGNAGRVGRRGARMQQWLDGLPPPQRRATYSHEGDYYSDHSSIYEDAYRHASLDEQRRNHTRRMLLDSNVPPRPDQRQQQQQQQQPRHRRRHRLNANTGVGPREDSMQPEEQGQPLEQPSQQDQPISQPITPSNSFAHLLDELLNTVTNDHNHSAQVAAEVTPAFIKGQELDNDNHVAGDLSASPAEHPNPLSQHPIYVEEAAMQGASTQHDQVSYSESIYSVEEDAGVSQLAGTTQQGDSTTPTDDLAHGIESLQLASTVRNASEVASRNDEALQPVNTNRTPSAADGVDDILRAQRIRVVPNSNGLTLPCYNVPLPQQSSDSQSPPATATRRTFSSSITRFMDRARSFRVRKHPRSETPDGIAEPQRPAKRLRNVFATAASRLSTVATPGSNDEAASAPVAEETGRQSRAIRLGSVASRSVSRTASGILAIGHNNNDNRRADAPEEVQVKLAIVGNKNVGKTQLIQHFLTGAFNTAKELSEKDLQHGYAVEKVELNVDDFRAKLDIWDVSSQCETTCAFENSVRPLMLSAFDAIVVCYDIGSNRSLVAALEKWKVVASRHCPGTPVVLVGLKDDLRSEWPTLRLNFLPHERTAIARGQGEQIAARMQASSYFECSARTGDGVVDFFHAMIRFSKQQQDAQRHEAVRQASTSCKVKAFFSKMRKRL